VIDKILADRVLEYALTKTLAPVEFLFTNKLRRCYTSGTGLNLKLRLVTRKVGVKSVVSLHNLRKMTKDSGDQTGSFNQTQNCGQKQDLTGQPEGKNVVIRLEELIENW
jgi:hypothetical protein